MRIQILSKLPIAAVLIFFLVAEKSHANGFGWGPPQMIIPYEAGVFLVECIVIALVLKPGVFKSLYLSFVANLVSWVAGTGVSLVSMLVSMAIHGWNPRKEVSYIIWAAAGQCFFLFMNAAVEMKIISEIGRIPMNRRLIRTVFYMNLATWAVGMWIFSELVKSG